ncbi:DNA polymerase I [Coccomyxa sp. Obi]|nr:DNA polymerase I [Coccomyxa sp. Obi]
MEVASHVSPHHLRNCTSRAQHSLKAESTSQRRRSLQKDLLTKARASSQYGTSTSGSSQGTVEPADRTHYNRRLVLVDAHALLYRSHFGFSGQRLANANGEDTSISYGFLNTVLRLLEIQEPPTHFAVVMDHHGKTFRHELYSDYKAQRPPMPDAMKLAIPKIQVLLEILGIPVIRVAGVEADDVIGTVARRASDDGFLVAIASPDKDFFQMLRPGLQLLRPPKKDARDGPGVVAGFVAYNSDAFREEFGIEPWQWTHVLGLMGDSSDNVPGVKGIGPKGALALIQQYGTIDGVLEHASEVKRKSQREQLQSTEGMQQARLSHKLVTIQSDVDLPPVRVPWESLELKAPKEENLEAIEKALGDLEFRQHSQRFTKIWAAMRAAATAKAH